MKTSQLCLISAGAICVFAVVAHAQDAAQPTVDLNAPVPCPALGDSPAAKGALSDLSQLDQGFKDSSLGKAADEYRTLLEWRRLQNATANDPAVVAAKQEVKAAPTDLEKRRRLRTYYDLYYGKMRARAATPEMKTALEQFKNDHLRMLAQPKVRPEEAATLPTPTATPEGKQKDKKKQKGGKLSKFRPNQ